MKKSLGAKTIVHPAPVWVIGTYDKEGKPNASTVDRRAFTVNVPSEKYATEAVVFAPDTFGYYGVGKYVGKSFSMGKNR
jgi:hypothetical protein